MANRCAPSAGDKRRVKPVNRRVRITVLKWGYGVRLNGADHQWGKNPPKEVVG